MITPDKLVPRPHLTGGMYLRAFETLFGVGVGVGTFFVTIRTRPRL